MQAAPRVLFASVLKPVDDVRSYHKLALTLLDNGKFRVTLAGYASKKTPKNSLAQLIPLFSGKRGQFGRILTYFKLFKLILTLKPDLVVTSTFEVIPVILAAKWIRHFVWVYDVQENHANNLRYNQSLPLLLRGVAIFTVKMLEGAARPFVDHFLLAEKCYLRELPHFRPATVIENKALEKYAAMGIPPEAISEPVKFVIAGTLAQVYGTYDALLWFEHYLASDKESSLCIVGHCPSYSFYNRIKKRFGHHPQIHWEVSQAPLTYEKIMTMVRQASVWLMPYRPLPSIAPKIPSKLYEALAMKKAILITHVPEWNRLVQQHSAGLAIDFSDYRKSVEHMKALLSMQLYPSPKNDEHLFWKEEAPKFLTLFQGLLKEDSR